jgi:LacI family transcriptional regulator, gluconate utilization system Gnt-I transcriptional repressor
VKKKITIQEVAKKTGYSTSTISRSISNPSVVSSKTRVKIEKFIKKTGYVHNYLAGSLKSGKSGFVIAIIPTLRLSVFSDYIYGIKEKLRENGFELLIGVTNYNLKTEEELVRKFVSYKPEGFIIVGTQHTEATTTFLLNSKSPIVETWNITDKPLDVVVGFSNFSAGHQITDHVISLNYKNIAFATPTNKHMESENRSKRRLSGFMSRMKIAKLKTTIFHYTEPMNHKLCGKQIFNQFKEHGSKIDCIICCSETSGAGLISELNSRKFQIPKKLGIAAVGNSDITSLLHPQLTTIDFKVEEIGIIAANNLINKIKNQKIKKIHDVGFELINGASVVNQRTK